MGYGGIKVNCVESESLYCIVLIVLKAVDCIDICLERLTKMLNLSIMTCTQKKSWPGYPMAAEVPRQRPLPPEAEPSSDKMGSKTGPTRPLGLSGYKKIHLTGLRGARSYSA